VFSLSDSVSHVTREAAYCCTDTHKHTEQSYSTQPQTQR